MGFTTASGDFQLHYLSLSTALILSLVLFSVFSFLARVFWHPLRGIPGPRICAYTSLWLHYHSWAGTQCSAIQKLHSLYGPVVRIAPNDVDISDGTALWPIYMEKGGFRKSSYYNTFDIDGHATIFTTLSLEQRSSRLKSIQSMFSHASTNSAKDIIRGCASRMVERLGEGKLTGKSVDILNLTRSYAIDAVSSYVLSAPYNGLDERNTELSASPFVDHFVGMSRFFHLSQSTCSIIEYMQNVFAADPQIRSSSARVDVFLRKMVEEKANALEKKKGDDSYASRLLRDGLSKADVVSECKDVVFAGTDSTGNNLATIIWYLIANPGHYETLRIELHRNEAEGLELQTLPYLTGVIKEALRLSMAISCRLPRVVPLGGFYHDGVYIPEDANVGVSAYQLHLNPDVFPEPEQFCPERWRNPTSEMNRDWLPFGRGARSCIARNLALLELYVATETVVKSDVLKGARKWTDKIESFEWFNSRVKNGTIELMWA